MKTAVLLTALLTLSTLNKGYASGSVTFQPNQPTAAHFKQFTVQETENENYLRFNARAEYVEHGQFLIPRASTQDRGIRVSGFLRKNAAGAFESFSNSAFVRPEYGEFRCQYSAKIAILIDQNWLSLSILNAELPFLPLSFNGCRSVEQHSNIIEEVSYSLRDQ